MVIFHFRKQLPFEASENEPDFFGHVPFQLHFEAAEDVCGCANRPSESPQRSAKSLGSSKLASQNRGSECLVTGDTPGGLDQNAFFGGVKGKPCCWGVPKPTSMCCFKNIDLAPRARWSASGSEANRPQSLTHSKFLGHSALRPMLIHVTG